MFLVCITEFCRTSTEETGVRFTPEESGNGTGSARCADRIDHRAAVQRICRAIVSVRNFPHGWPSPTLMHHSDRKGVLTVHAARRYELGHNG